MEMGLEKYLFHIQLKVKTEAHGFMLMQKKKMEFGIIKK